MKRRLTAIAAAAGLAGIIVGLPLTLIATHNVAAPRLGWSLDGLWRTLLAPDDGTLLATVIKLVGWSSWAILTAMVAVEIGSRARHVPVPRLRGLAWPQLLARGLVSAILAGFIATSTSTPATGPLTAHPSDPPPAHTLSAPLQAPSQKARAGESYTVKRGDTLSEIALEELGNGHAYPRIFKASRATIQPDGRMLKNPDLILPGWKLTIPVDKVETAKPPDHGREPHDKSNNGEHDPTAPPASATPAPAPATGSSPVRSSAPTAQETTTESAHPVSHINDRSNDVTPAWEVAGLAGAGSLLAGAALLLLQRRRRAQFRARRPGRTIAVPAAGLAPVEKTFIHSGGPTAEIVIAIDEGLRRLASAIATSGQPVPRLVGTITARFADPVTLPGPWTSEADPTTWSADRLQLVATGPLEEASPPPWPQLATVGLDEQGRWRLINFEALGVVTITGDPEYGADLARYLAAELAVVPWARDLRVDCIGTCAELALMNPARLRYHEANTVIGQAIAAAEDSADRLSSTATPGIETARVRQEADRIWDSRILISKPDVDELSELTKLIAAQAGRTGTSVLLVRGDDVEVPNGLELRVSNTGRVQIPHLGIDLVVNGLTPAEAKGCAAVLAAGDTLDDEPSPIPEQTTHEWEKLCDESGQLREDLTVPRNETSVGESTTLLPGEDERWVAATANTPEDLAAIAPLVPVEVRTQSEAADPRLDADLAEWSAERCDRPRLSVLGPTRVRVGPGGDPSVVAKRTPYYTEILTYLATTARATTDEVATAMGLADSRVRKDMSVLRAWLGNNPRTGGPFLPDAAHNSAASARGVGQYLVEDLLDDATLFRRLRLRGEARGADGLPDLLAALRLVTGAPYEDLKTRGRAWLTDTRPDRYMLCAIVDVAHVVATIALEAGDIRQARAAAELALLVAPEETTPALDLAAIAARQGRDDEAAALARSVVEWRDGSDEPPVELPARADRILRTHRWLDARTKAS
jgi:LysM repeat protein